MGKQTKQHAGKMIVLRYGETFTSGNDSLGFGWFWSVAEINRRGWSSDYEDALEMACDSIDMNSIGR